MFLSAIPDIGFGARQKRWNRENKMSSLSTAVSPGEKVRTGPALPSGLWAEVVLPSLSLWWREVVRFYRMKSRVVGVIASPVLFWLVMGSGFGSSVKAGAGRDQHYLQYFFPGAVIMIVLFTAI